MRAGKMFSISCPKGQREWKNRWKMLECDKTITNVIWSMRQEGDGELDLAVLATFSRRLRVNL